MFKGKNACNFCFLYNYFKIKRESEGERTGGGGRGHEAFMTPRSSTPISVQPKARA